MIIATSDQLNNCNRPISLVEIVGQNFVRLSMIPEIFLMTFFVPDDQLSILFIVCDVLKKGFNIQ